MTFGPNYLYTWAAITFLSIDHTRKIESQLFLHAAKHDCANSSYWLFFYDCLTATNHNNCSQRKEVR